MGYDDLLLNGLVNGLEPREKVSQYPKNKSAHHDDPNTFHDCTDLAVQKRKHGAYTMIKLASSLTNTLAQIPALTNWTTGEPNQHTYTQLNEAAQVKKVMSAEEVSEYVESLWAELTPVLQQWGDCLIVLESTVSSDFVKEFAGRTGFPIKQILVGGGPVYDLGITLNQFPRIAASTPQHFVFEVKDDN